MITQSNGSWGTAAACTNQACAWRVHAPAICCTPGAVTCSGNAASRDTAARSASGGRPSRAARSRASAACARAPASTAPCSARATACRRAAAGAGGGSPVALHEPGDASNGACTGTCAPGLSARCSGQQPQTVQSRASAAWQSSGSACVNQDLLGRRVPGGVRPRARRSARAGRKPQTCNGSGAWQNGDGLLEPDVMRERVCCTGSCAPGTADDVLGQRGRVVPGERHLRDGGGLHEPDVRERGVRGRTCAPGQTTCSGTSVETCNSSGAAYGSPAARVHDERGQRESDLRERRVQLLVQERVHGVRIGLRERADRQLQLRFVRACVHERSLQSARAGRVRATRAPARAARCSTTSAARTARPAGLRIPGAELQPLTAKGRGRGRGRGRVRDHGSIEPATSCRLRRHCGCRQ